MLKGYQWILGTLIKLMDYGVPAAGIVQLLLLRGVVCKKHNYSTGKKLVFHITPKPPDFPMVQIARE